jgi:membrane protease YdiL (CAAX protease family)
MLRWLWSALFLVVLAGCPRPTSGRMDALAEPAPIEVDAAERIAARKCPPGIGIVFPGVGPLCDGREAEGAALMAVGATDVAAAVAIPLAHGGAYAGGVTLPITWLQNAYVTTWARPALDRQLARKALYVPRDDLGELVLAPFNGHVMKRPLVWAGTIALIGGAFLVTAAQPDGVAPKAGVNWFGADLPPGIGWPLVTVTEAYTFEHVAVGEEMLFRGMIQSALARGVHPWGGWAISTVIFGAAHLTNVVNMSSEEASAYLRYSLPYITLVGAVLGLAYMDARYSLTSSVAIHFWYDFALSMAATIVDPENSVVAARFSFPF